MPSHYTNSTVEVKALNITALTPNIIGLKFACLSWDQKIENTLVMNEIIVENIIFMQIILNNRQYLSEI